MEFHGRLGMVTKTLIRVWNDLYHFFILFFASVVMMAFMGWNMLGADSPEFRDMPWSVSTILLMAIGVRLAINETEQGVRATTESTVKK